MGIDSSITRGLQSDMQCACSSKNVSSSLCRLTSPHVNVFLFNNNVVTQLPGSNCLHSCSCRNTWGLGRHASQKTLGLGQHASKSQKLTPRRRQKLPPKRRQHHHWAHGQLIFLAHPRSQGVSQGVKESMILSPWVHGAK